MRILAIDTAGWVASVAVWEDGNEQSFLEDHADKGQASLLPDLVRKALGGKKVDQIIVNKGPGSFTGIRLGLAFAKGLAMGWNVPLKGLDGFRITYMNLEPLDDVLVLIESRRQDVYAQRFKKGIPENPLSLTRENLEEILSTKEQPVITGSGVNDLIADLQYTEIKSKLKGAQCLALAFFKGPEYFSDPLPFYVREADVSINQNSCLSQS
jgi:tRNA threonylcarbamoyl adenosine modification protein YeaZ